MADHIKALDPMRFLKLGEKRQQAIASGNGIISEHSANKLARELHPQRQFLVVKEIISQAAGCNTYLLAPDTQKGTEKLAYFSAGQYISVKVDIDGHTYNRPYSLVSSPRESLNGRYAITVKGTAGGLVSEYILSNWQVGTSVEVYDPMGNFTYEPLRDARHIVGISGGSGITPFVSLAKAIADGDEDCSLTLLCGYRNLAERLHLAELDEICRRCEKVKVVYVLSDERADGFENGFITAETVRKYAPKDKYSVFVCGPRALHSHIEKESEKLGIDGKYVRHELFGEAFLADGKEHPVTITVIYRGETVKAKGSADESILRILEENNISAPSRCRSGECGFCRAKLLSGEVIIPKETDRRRLADETHGYIHPCCTYPNGDITIEIGAGK